jgi:hypothetical protein
MDSSTPSLGWERLPSVERLDLATARRAHRVFAYARTGALGLVLVVVGVVDERDTLLARSTYATATDPRRVAERVLAASRLERYSFYRPDPMHRERRVEALVGPRVSTSVGAYERELRNLPPRTA